MVLAMLLGGLRRCEVLGLRLEDVQAGERRLFIAEGKGGHQRIVPVSSRFFAAWPTISSWSGRTLTVDAGVRGVAWSAAGSSRCRRPGWTRCFGRP